MIGRNTLDYKDSETCCASYHLGILPLLSAYNWSARFKLSLASSIHVRMSAYSPQYHVVVVFSFNNTADYLASLELYPMDAPA